MSRKEIMLSFRVTEHESKRVFSLAKKSNMNLSEYLRHSSTSKEIKVVDGLEELSKELRAVGRNLNQLTRLCNQGKLQCLDLGSIKNKIAKITEKVSEFL